MRVSKEIINVCLYGVLGMLLFIVTTIYSGVNTIANQILEPMQIIGFVLMVLPLIYLKMLFIKSMSKKGGDE